MVEGCWSFGVLGEAARDVSWTQWTQPLALASNPKVIRRKVLDAVDALDAGRKDEGNGQGTGTREQGLGARS